MDKSVHQSSVEVAEPSFWPILLALSLLLIASGVIFTWIVSVVGIVGLLACIAGWTLENRSREILMEERDE